MLEIEHTIHNIEKINHYCIDGSAPLLGTYANTNPVFRLQQAEVGDTWHVFSGAWIIV
jgi:hypothetical protein